MLYLSINNTEGTAPTSTAITAAAAQARPARAVAHTCEVRNIGNPIARATDYDSQNCTHPQPFGVL